MHRDTMPGLAQTGVLRASAPRQRLFRLALPLLMASLACCSGGSHTPAPVAVIVLISPTTATVYQGNTSTFRSSAGPVNWSVQEGTAGGSISGNGLYTAPKTAGTYHVVAVSQTDSSKSATATVTVPPVTLTVSPTSDVLGPAGVRAFSIYVTSSDSTVDWSVVEGASAGSLTDSTYTAPNSTGTFHVLARYHADTTLSATATVTVVTNGFTPTATTRDERYAHTSTLLVDGRVLNVGGFTCNLDYYYYASCPTASASVYDPNANQLSSVSSMQQKRAFHTATRLANGKVLITGGGSAIAEIFDPATGSFSATGSMSINRTDHTATLLKDGTVLIAGGYGLGTTSTAELYDSQAGTFTAVANMLVPRANHTATLLANGQVLITGGTSGGAPPTAELYDPATRTFTATGSLTQARSEHTATLLANGSVLIAGGTKPGAPYQYLDSVEIYQPANGGFSTAGNLIAAHSGHAAVLLPSGKVLLIGGTVPAPYAPWTAELFDPLAGTSAQTGSLRDGRFQVDAVALSDGRVVVTGGGGPTSIEIYK
jgi:hypothetical protein